MRWQPNEEIVLEAFPDHFKAPKIARWIMRIVPNAEATLGMLKRGELNFLGFFGGDPEVLVKFAKENPDIVITTETDVGFEFVAFNNRRPPFDDAAFRRALSLRDRPPADGLGGVAGLRRAGQQPRLAGAELLARPGGRRHQDRPRRSPRRSCRTPATGWSAASSTTPPASRKS